MKKKELKNLAEKIAQQEYIIQNSQNSDEIKQAQSCIMSLSSKVKSFEDIMILDELIQEFIEKI
jgi:hypothetical protein